VWYGVVSVGKQLLPDTKLTQGRSLAYRQDRARINLLAQNEFARARRYGEPYSCLLLEIDRYDEIIRNSVSAAEAVVHVFTGYCVVVMRHCDSFGRLAPSRFLALLPETPAGGAITLATRMCRDLAELGVMVEGAKLNFTVSIGVAELHASDRWAGDVLRRAEQGLEDAIERGRGCAEYAPVPAVVFDAEDGRDARGGGSDAGGAA
jgi:diguanylate cyclase (GGDEF)-like protein